MFNTATPVGVFYLPLRNELGMSLKATQWVWEQEGIPLTTRAVLLSIADMVNREGEAWPSLNTIAKKCEVTRRMVRIHVSKAVELGVVIRQQNAGKSSTYTFARVGNILPRKDITGRKHTSYPVGNILPTPTLSSNRNGTVTTTQREVEEKIFVVKALESLEGLGVKVTKRMSGFVTKFSESYPDMPVEWIETAAKQIEERDIEKPWLYMKAMLKQWNKIGGPQNANGFNGNRVPKTSADADFIPGVTPSPLL